MFVVDKMCVCLCVCVKMCVRKCVRQKCVPCVREKCVPCVREKFVPCVRENVYRVYAKGVRKICVSEKCVPCVRENVYRVYAKMCTRKCVREVAKLVLFWEFPVSFAIWWWLKLEFDWLSRFNMLCYLMNQIAFGISFKLRFCWCNPDEKLERI